MKKLLFLGLMLTSSMNAYAFPHMADYKVETRELTNAGNVEFRMFVSTDIAFELQLASTKSGLDGKPFKGHYGVCPITDYCVYVSGVWGDAEITILDANGKKEDTLCILYNSKNETMYAYFNDGYMIVTREGKDMSASWAEYVK